MTAATTNPDNDLRVEALDFHHPFTPYNVQLQFMRAAYDVLEKGNGQVGILESPTGTGKSLSLICSTLTWLRNHKRQQYEATFEATAAGMEGEPDWMVEATLRRKRDELARRWEEREAQLERVRAREKDLEEKAGRASKRQRLDDGDDEGPSSKGKRKALDEEAEFLIDDWHDSTDGVSDDDPLSQLSKETRALLARVGLGGAKKIEEEEYEAEDEIKASRDLTKPIYYTSRTHSQLTQFIAELRRPTFPPSIPSELLSKGGQGDRQSNEVVKQLPLSSRQKLCINPAVSRLGSLSAINDRCTELQQSKSDAKCAFMPNADNLKQTHQFRDTVLAMVPDIEDMYRIGKQIQVCPYYASRTAIPGAEVITLPYPLLLQKSARDALGIKLEGNVVIIDEAHNIMDAVANVYAAEICLSELRRARQMLGAYVKRFGKKLKGENRVMVARVGRVVESLSEWLDGASSSKVDQGIADPNMLLKSRGADQTNLYKLIRYIQESKLAYKIESYMSHAESEQDPSTAKKGTRSSPVLHTLVSFLTALTNLSAEGRIFYEKIAGSPPDIKLSYLLLSPTHAFSSIASSARAVILAGGTMSPFDDYKAHLFPTFSPEKITTLSCGHVIPSSSLCVWTLASTMPIPAGSSSNAAAPDAFEFSFQKRSDRTMIRQLGLALLNMCSVVPDGVVVFFPSYGYLDQVVAVWQAADPSQLPSKPENSTPPTKPLTLWDRLTAKKFVFRETKGSSSDEVLQSYTQAILSPPPPNPSSAAASADPKPRQAGALLLSVVGGKMSEGINFSDRLGRCVVIVGLPYPNMQSAEWKARIEYIESSTVARLMATHTDATNGNGGNGAAAPAGAPPTREQAVAQAKQVARDFYENACMRAVNQSIGRAIRHRGDYAAIVLADRRFATDRIRAKLPGWIRGGMAPGTEAKGLQGLMGAMSGFFRGKRGGAVDSCS
ncbi:DNA repair helicase [Lasiosphaeria miniovina]|uniref:ATP-dependent DNA helicase CHL1 n=1 Tax=Lasiosphaeria miniovina TaxID=1954250 RepID=A0AA40DW87_9PEZI|nr:DNA repair helicase [Lasiosphaeria miniovina]KAK0714048.1 DNA repair helicase [Lasiosphaeria miniovina]